MRRAVGWILLVGLVGVGLWLALRPEPVALRVDRAEPLVHTHAPTTLAEDPLNVPAPLIDLAREHQVELVYFVPSDREPRSAYAERMRVAARFAADFIRRDLADKGYATNGIGFVFDGDRARVELVRGLQPASYYRSDEAKAEARGHVGSYDDGHFWSVYHEVTGSLGPHSRRIYVIFSETYDDGEPCFDAHGNIARGVILSPDSGAVVISAWVASERCCAADAEQQLVLFDDCERVEGCRRKDGTRVALPRFEFVEDALGSLTHELGHALGALHDFRTPGEDLMGRGSRAFRPGYRGRSGAPPRVWISPQNALFLRHSPFLFDDVDRSDTSEPTQEGHLGEHLRAGDTEVPIHLTATDDRDLAALVFFSPRLDTILAGCEAHGRRFEFESRVNHPPLKSGMLEIVAFALDSGGNRSAIVMRREVE